MLLIKTEKHPQKELSKDYTYIKKVKDVLSEANAEQNLNRL